MISSFLDTSRLPYNADHQDELSNRWSENDSVKKMIWLAGRRSGVLMGNHGPVVLGAAGHRSPGRLPHHLLVAAGKLTGHSMAALV